MPKGGTIRIAMRIPKLEDPHTFSWVYDSNGVRQVCGYLTRTGADNVTRPHLASKWEASEDLKTWTFTIADDAMAEDGSLSPPRMRPGTSSTASIRRSAPRSSA